MIIQKKLMEHKQMQSKFIKGEIQNDETFAAAAATATANHF